MPRKLIITSLTSLIIGLFMVSSSLAASQSSLKALSVKADAPKRYEVKQGDSLWEISAKFLNDPWMWPQVWRGNSYLDNPHVIYPGDVIELLETENRLQLVPRLRILTLQEPIPFMPLSRLSGFLSRDVMIERSEFEDALYAVSLQDGRELASKGDALEVLGKMPEEHSGYFGIYRELEEVRDPLTRQHLGFHARALGSAKLVHSKGDLPRLEILESLEEVRIGDRLLPLEENPFGEGFQPQRPNFATHGTLLGNLNRKSFSSNYDVVMLNVGEQELQPGYLLEVIEPGKRLRNYETGEVVFAGENSKGTLMVYRVFENTSFAVVMQANQPLLAGDVFRRNEPN